MKTPLGPSDGAAAASELPETQQTPATPLLDAMLEEGRMSSESPSRIKPQSQCRWNPCTYILFGQPGETHEEYHQRKGQDA